MDVIVVGGFLGSGKTTTVINMGKYLADKGKKIAIIVNEIGEIGIDGDIIKKFGFDTKEITSGCICCTLKMGLRTTVDTLMKEYKPDILMIEPTGIAFPNSIKNEFKLMNLGEEVKVAPLVTLIDGSRFKHLMKEIKDFAMRQIIDAEILGINKVDLIDSLQIPILEVSVRQLNPTAKVVILSGKDTGERFESFIQLVLPGVKDIPNKTKKAEEETESTQPDFENSNDACGIDSSEENSSNVPYNHGDSFKHAIGSYSAEYSLKDGRHLSKETARTITTEIMNKIKEKTLKLNPEFLGHIKLFLDNGSETVKQSITIYNEEPQEDIFKSNDGATPTFKVLSAVSKVEKEVLKNAVNSSVQETFEKMGIEIQQVKHSHDHEHHHGHDHPHGHDEKDGNHRQEHNHHHGHDEEEYHEEDDDHDEHEHHGHDHHHKHDHIREHGNGEQEHEHDVVHDCCCHECDHHKHYVHENYEHQRPHEVK
ncbi:GTP-binding protein [Methanosarcina sp. T3]|uniref:GTP-binding protein n=1 Tax=Methanosarcina sp. T3 TaxID=3439062 RepID=UPI003F83A373